MIDVPALDEAVHTLLRDVSQKVILPYYQTLTSEQVEEKSPDDLVTVADRLSEEMLAIGLAQIIPGLPIVGEEDAHADPSILDRLSDDCWIVDPIDGTNNFAHGRPPFGVLIAMASGGIAHTGWIYDPLTDRLCTAQRGKGAFINGEPVRTQVSGADLPVAAISTQYMDMAKRQAVMDHIAPHYTMVDIPRCAAEQYPRLALGTNDVSIFERTLPWDHAAGALWLNEAGGRVARMDGSPYRVDEHGRTGLIGAATPELFDELAIRLDRMPQDPA